MNITLFCFPFAGGSKYSLQFLKKVLPSNIHCHFFEYPGRGTRMKEPFADDVSQLVNDAFNQVALAKFHQPYAIYGHSMGGKAAYLFARLLRDKNLPAPMHLFISGTDAPSVPNKEEPRYLLPKDTFISRVKEMGGLPDELLQHTELLEYFEPILRADFKVSETYIHQPAEQLQLPITVMVGDEEDMEEEDILAWQQETNRQMRLVKFPGNHFFIFNHEKEIGNIISESLGL